MSESSISNVRLLSNKELAALKEKQVSKDNPAQVGDLLYYSKIEDDKHMLASLGKVGAAKVTQYLSQPDKKAKLIVYKSNEKTNRLGRDAGVTDHHAKRTTRRTKSC
jgi:hypothetical protein